MLSPISNSSPRKSQVPAIPDLEIIRTPQTPRVTRSVNIPSLPELESPAVASMPTPKYEPQMSTPRFEIPSSPRNKKTHRGFTDIVSEEINGFFNWFFRF
jgi:hypothetical protein